MLGILKKLFSSGPATDYKQLVQNGAIILDVRTAGEYAGGHIKGSINIPVQELGNNKLSALPKGKAIITCCASGMRSASARNILMQRGYSEVYNGGGWAGLKSKLS